jgi:hypothetical protein
MMRTTTAVVLAVLMGVPTYSFACDQTQPQCQAVNKILERVGYREKLLEGQRLCEANAEQLSPEELESKGVARLVRLKKGEGGWTTALEAHRKFVNATCGGEEVVQVVLNIYRKAWEAAVPGAELLKMATSSGELDSKKVQAVNRVASASAAALLDRMHQQALEEYENEIKALGDMGAEISVSALCPNGEKDESTQTCKTKR